MGIVLMGLAALNAPYTRGTIPSCVAWLNCSLTLFLLGVIEQRFGTSDITALGGLAKVYQYLAVSS